MFSEMRFFTKRLKPCYQLWVSVLLLMAINPVIAQAEKPEQGVTQGIGFTGGYIQGTGLMYVRYLGSHMLQASFGAAVDRFKSDYQASLSYARYIHHVRKPVSLLPVALKAIAGVDVHYQDGLVDTGVINYDETVYPLDERAWFYHVGAGVGIDIWHPAETGLVYSLVLTYALSIEEVNGKQEWELSPLPAVSILYNW